MVLAATCGLLAAAGSLLVADGAARRIRPRPSRTPRRIDRARVGRALAAAAAALVLTRWPVAAAGAGALVWCWPSLFGLGRDRANAIARTEAVAAWTEMLRDTIAGAHGLEEAVITSAGVAPEAIAGEVASLAAALETEPLDAALARFGADLAHPTADLVVAALVQASRGAAGDLTGLLGTLAAATREEAAMHLRVGAARARVRTAVRVIAGVTSAMAAGLVILNPSYLEVYSTVGGQVVLGLVITTWAVGLWLLARMARLVAPERFLVSGEASRVEALS